MPSKKLIGFQFPDNHKCELCSYEKRLHSIGKLFCPTSVNAFGATYQSKKSFVPVRDRKVVIRGQDSKKLHDPI